MRLAFALLGAWLLLGTPVPPAWANDGDGDGTERPSSGGRLIYDSHADLDLLGDFWAHLPFPIRAGRGPFVAAEARTAIESASDAFAFLVRDLDYDFALGYRDRRGWFAEFPAALFVAEKGKLAVDAPGRTRLRWVGLAVESRNFRSATSTGLAWRVAGGPVFQERGTRGEAVLRSRLRLMPRRWHWGRTHLGIDAETDGQIHAGRYLADLSAGPNVAIALDGDRQARLFVHWQRSRDPLGIGHSAWLAGFEYSEGSGAPPPGGLPSPPEVDGLLAWGGGESGRLTARFRLRVLSPSLRAWRVAFVVDANVVTGTTTQDLYYLYHLGGERSLGRSVVGVYFYHRSNHALSRPNDTVTSINVLEAGLETAGWHRTGRPSLDRAWGRLDARARVGWLIDSSFGEDRRWHVRAGLRWSVPVTRRLFPYLGLEAEYGDVRRRSVSLGVAPWSRWAFQLEHRSDDQWFDAERRAWLVGAAYGF